MEKVVKVVVVVVLLTAVVHRLQLPLHTSHHPDFQAIRMEDYYYYYYYYYYYSCFLFKPFPHIPKNALNPTPPAPLLLLLLLSLLPPPPPTSPMAASSPPATLSTSTTTSATLVASNISIMEKEGVRKVNRCLRVVEEVAITSPIILLVA